MNSIQPTILIVDDDANVCSALKCLFESVNYNVETYHSAHSFLEHYDNNKKSCLIIDVRMPNMSGLQLLELLNLRKTNLPVIVMSGHGDIQMAVRAMKLGAVDFVLKPFNEQCLLDIVQKYAISLINTKKNDQSEMIDQIITRINSLTPRERQIISLISDGKLNKEIAYELSVSMSTVEVHRSNIMHKMKAKNFAQLVKTYLKYQFHMEALCD